jgi:hypothetical protein
LIWKTSKRWFCLRSKGHELYVLEQLKGSEVQTTFNMARCTSVRCQDPDNFLSIGSPVYVPRFGIGKLRYFGPRHKLFHDMVVGIELQDPFGYSNGTLDDRRYFTCQDNHAIFVAPNEFRPVDASGKVMKLEKGRMFGLEITFQNPKTIDAEAHTEVQTLFAPSFAEMQRWVFAMYKAVFESVPKVVSMKLPTSILEAPWFHGNIPRADAESLLQRYSPSKSTGQGNFLVRLSTSQPGSLVISVVGEDGIHHTLIVMSRDLCKRIDTSHDSTDFVIFKINNVITQVRSFSALLVHLTTQREDINWRTPLRRYAQRPDGPSTKLDTDTCLLKLVELTGDQHSSDV